MSEVYLNPTGFGQCKIGHKERLRFHAYLSPDSWEDDEEGQVEGGEDGAQGDGGDVADHRGPVGVGVEGGAAILAEQVEPAAHHLEGKVGVAVKEGAGRNL